MRAPILFITLLLSSSLLVAAPVSAQETSPPPEKEQAKPKVDWVDVESTGVISSAKDGALDKMIWSGQKRSEIEYLLSRLPAEHELRSTFSLQRRLLLSRTEAGQINNDIGPLRGNDILIQRIRKLMQMGLYDDAWELYTQKAEDPHDVSIARLGMELLVLRNDLATACLEEKVFAARYPNDEFFKTLDKACGVTLGVNQNPQFPENGILQKTYNDRAFSISATDYTALTALSDIERALLLANGKIRYEGLSREILSKTPSSLLSLYLLDKNLSEQGFAIVKAETDARGLSPYLSTVRDDILKKAKDTKDTETRWTILESVIANRDTAELIPFAGMIAESEPKNLSPKTFTKILGVLLAAGQELPDYWLDAAQKLAQEKPLVSIYLYAFKTLTPTKVSNTEWEDILPALHRMKPADSEQVIAIIDTLGGKTGYETAPFSIYDKQSELTLRHNYVMPTLGLQLLLETAPDSKQSGITVLTVLNSLYAEPENLYSGTSRKALEAMLNVGLIEDARMIGSEIIASVLNKY